jgi:hypothetical protein
MSGDHTIQHNAVRDVYHDFCSRGHLRPVSEAPKVLADILGKADRHRPADVLCVPALVLAQKLPDGSRAVRTEPVCFDFAVINALGANHWAGTCESPGQAAEKYAADKCARNSTESLCMAAGYRFWPVIHEAQGGSAKAADAAQRAIADAVAEAEGRSSASVHKEMRERIALVTSRCFAKAIAKRTPVPAVATPAWSTALLLSKLGSGETEDEDRMEA